MPFYICYKYNSNFSCHITHILVTVHPAKLVFHEKSPTIVIAAKSNSQTRIASKAPNKPKVLSEDQVQTLNTGKLHNHLLLYACSNVAICEYKLFYF